MRIITRLALLVAAMGLSGCAHSIHEVHTSDFSPYAQIEQGNVVKAKAEQFVILGFTSETEYVDQAYRALMSQCPTGVVTGITTQLSTSLGFLSWTNKVLIQGLCVRPGKT